MSMDFRGDPSAALLEVLDPEQNYMFMDHYLDVEYDLSQVFFIATANVLHTVPPALQDRMEVIRLSGYTELEKLEIAKRFLVPKQMKQTGLKSGDLEFTDEGLQSLIQFYTREAGVRNLEREIGNVSRKVARKVVNAQSAKNSESKNSESRNGDAKKRDKAILNAETVSEFLGPQKFRDLQADKKNEVGATVGLAWTEVGGSILTTEAAVMEGKGKLQTTGKLGDVMQESAHAAMSYVRSRAQLLGLPRDFYRNVDIHVHVPEGAIPKDGPSAGITIATSICSALTNIPVHCDLAMTGEITVRGRVLPIGGLKEKVLAAHRQGIYHLVLPKDNEKDLPDIPENIRKEMRLEFVTSMDEVLKIALERELVALPLAATTPPVELVRGGSPEERISI
jgi:ATP-dependent Lon protease